MSSTPTKRTIACHECHKKKTKCNGQGPPCSTCADLSIECTYPVRDKKTKVGQRYLDKLEAENKRLAALVSSLSTSSATPAAQTLVEPRADNADRNPLIEERPWFLSFKNVDLPIHIGDAADAGFSTRLRQAASSAPVSHLPRVNYLADDALRSFGEVPIEFPSASRVRFLVDVALKTTSRNWHISRRSVVLEDVRRIKQDPGNCDWLTKCRIWALLAIGEAFSSRCVLPNEPFPGARYWTRAMQLAHMPSERPKLDIVEVNLLMACYAASMNRRHTAILLASHAMRLCVVLGLHIEIGETQLRDPVMREHRCRLWWTAYRFDRMWASKIGWPPSIPDDSVEIGMPSDQGLANLSPEIRGDFGDAEYIVMSVRLAKMLNHAVNTLYVRRRQPTSFSERVQVAVRALRDWAEGLPEHLKLDDSDADSRVEGHILYLHLAFNQAVIVITRPILLHLYKQRQTPIHQDSAPPQTFSESALSLTTACIRCARQSMGMLKRAWAEGTFPTFDYFHTQFLFSSATILALSALLQNSGWMGDREDFLLAWTFLQQLELNGNFGAKEVCMHVEALEMTLRENLDVGSNSVQSGVAEVGARPTFAPVVNPPLQDFLNHPEIDLDFMDTGGNWIDWQDVFWPEMEPPVG